MLSQKEITERALAKLKESGLKPDPKSKFRTFTADRARSLHPSLEERGGILIPYFDVDGRRREDVFRVRYLEDPTGGWKPKKPAKYGQPTGSPVAAYFSPLIEDWPEILENSNRDLFITEGEFKAASACALGYPTIGLGGVYSFQSAKRGVDFLPELDDVNWKGRRVYVVYDSDIIHKPEVQQALNALCAKLTDRGAVPKVIRLPSSVYGGEEKVGLDDYLVKYGVSGFTKLIGEAEDYGPGRRLAELNERFAYFASQMCVIDFEPDDPSLPYQFVPLWAMQRGLHYPEMTAGPRGGASPLTNKWLTWSHRRKVANIVYLPGEMGHIDGSYNCWRGWGIRPEKGDVRPFLALLEHLIPQEDRRKWFTAWLAWPIQNPGAKLYSAAVLWGLHPGTGKSFVGYVMGDIYGQNFNEISSEQLGSRFNDWGRFRQFVMIDEAVEGTSVRELSGHLKRLVTQETMLINEKYQKPYPLKDTVNYYFTSNQPHCLKLDQGDRRYFIHEVKSLPLPKARYEKLDRWRKGGGSVSWFYYLLHEVDLKDFDPKGHAFQTDDKSKMVELNDTPALTFLRTLIKNDESSKRGDLYTIADLQSLQDNQYRQRADNMQQLGRALATLGIQKQVVYIQGELAHHPTKNLSLYAIYRTEVWAKKSKPEWAKHYAEWARRSGVVKEAAEANF